MVNSDKWLIKIMSGVEQWLMIMSSDGLWLIIMDNS